jgi:glycosyltransferase 2 family protein
MKALLKTIAIASALGLALFALRDQLANIPGQLATANLTFLALSAIGLVIYQLWNAGVWSEVLGAMCFKSSRSKCMRIWIASESMKWLPGSIWSYGSRIVSGQSLGLSKKQVSASIAFELILTNIAWATLAATVFFNAEILSLLSPKIELLKSYLWVPVLVAAIFAVALFLVRGTIAAKLGDLLQLRSVSVSKSARTILHYIVLSLFNATLFWGVISAIPGIEVSFSVVVALSGIAWLTGFWAIGIPGGLGVREAVITLILTQFGSLEAAIFAAVLWRVIQVGAEIAALVISLATGCRKHDRLSQRQEPLSA